MKSVDSSRTSSLTGTILPDRLDRAPFLTFGIDSILPLSASGRRGADLPLPQSRLLGDCRSQPRVSDPCYLRENQTRPLERPFFSLVHRQHATRLQRILSRGEAIGYRYQTTTASRYAGQREERIEAPRCCGVRRRLAGD